MTLPPWLHAHRDRLLHAVEQARLPHALLICGLPGVGKGLLAKELVAALLCSARSEETGACGQCRGCQLRLAGTHPDQRQLHPLEGKQNIGIDQVRELSAFLMLKSQYAGYRIGLMRPAEGMTVGAANSLLKTLEEPPSDAVLILVADRPADLPATVRSRCQQVRIGVPSREQARAWLQDQAEGDAAMQCLNLVGGAPLAALAAAGEGMPERRESLLGTLAGLRAGKQDPVTAAEAWKGEGELLSRLLLQLTGEMMRIAAGAIANSDQSRLQALLNGLDLIGLYKFADRLLEVRRNLDHPLNEQLVLEELFIEWCGLCTGSQRR